MVQLPDDLELTMGLHIDLRAGVEGDLHLVQALLVAGLGLAHATTAGPAHPRRHAHDGNTTGKERGPTSKNVETFSNANPGSSDTAPAGK